MSTRIGRRTFLPTGPAAVAVMGTPLLAGRARAAGERLVVGVGDAVAREFDLEKRAKLTHDLGQRMYSGYHGVMLGMTSTTWAVSKKMGDWQTLAYTPMETNYEHVSASG